MSAFELYLTYIISIWKGSVCYLFIVTTWVCVCVWEKLYNWKIMWCYAWKLYWLFCKATQVIVFFNHHVLTPPLNISRHSHVTHKTWFFHTFSFPTRHREERSRRNVKICRKHANLIKIIFIVTIKSSCSTRYDKSCEFEKREWESLQINNDIILPFMTKMLS